MTENATLQRVKYLQNRFCNWKEGDYYTREHYAQEITFAEDWLEYHFGWSKSAIEELRTSCMVAALVA